MLSVGVFSSCDDLLSVDSDRFISADDHNMTAANDTLYAMYGVFSQFQKLADAGFSDARLYKFAGNAVSVPVITALGRFILSIESEANESAELCKEPC